MPHDLIPVAGNEHAFGFFALLVAFIILLAINAAFEKAMINLDEDDHDE